MMSGTHDGLTAVVTGGASGIGRALVSALAERGATVASLDRQLEAESSADCQLVCDVTDNPSVEETIGEIVDRFGGIDILVNNAGIGAQGDIAADDDATWQAVFDVNVFGIVRVSRAALAPLRRSSAAAVVNIGSIAGWSGLPERAAYSASKGAVHALTLAMAADGIADGIRVNAVAPGTADTPWVQRLLDRAPDPEAERKALAARQPSGRLVTAEEVADTVCFLSSPEAAAITGTIVAVDGGMFGLRTRPKN